MATLSAQTGASVGIDVRVTRVRARAVRGRMGIQEALGRMLARTPFRAEPVGPMIWRLVFRGRASATAIALTTAPVPDIVVTARKYPETLSRIGTPISVYIPRDASARHDLHDVIAGSEGVSATNLGAGRDRPFIRGIADSPFNGFSQATVSINLDDARVTYDAPEPGLRLVDVARVEVLKGPQGPLYGTGALGGVYRIVTNRPVLGSYESASSFGLDATSNGGPGGDATGMVNAPLFAGRAAIRLVGYAETRSGWVRNAARVGRVNDATVAGGRAALRILPAPGWTVDLGSMRQTIRLRDSQYVDRDAEDLTRSPRFPEPSSSTFSLLNASAGGPVGSLRLIAATSHSWQSRSDTYDVTPVASMLGYVAGRTYQDRRRHRVFDQEVRLASGEGHPFAWTAGLSYLAASTIATGTLRDSADAVLPFSFALHRIVTEAAIFADGSTDVLPGLRAGMGVRIFRSTTDDERSEGLSTAVTARASIGVTPSGSLTYAFADDRNVYLRFGTAFRPGGLDPTNTKTGRYDADEVRSVDLGTRLRFADRRLSVSAGAFRTAWSYVQSDYLLSDGLVGTRNAGDALILGAEATAEWRSGPWSLVAGGMVQHARLERAADGSELPEDRRLPTVPDMTARLDIARSIRIVRQPTRWAIRAAYVGHSRLSFDDGLDRKMGGYTLLASDVSTTVGEVELRVGLENMFNARADSFALGNPFRIRTEREYTPLRPRTITIGIERRF
ncbi:TonB-dependent receptor [Sphingomonas sp. S-NIH.Pt1_0416]|nr:TonB-dependent receptor [Sphingomonas sp. S-NIH.Pt1_0416]